MKTIPHLRRQRGHALTIALVFLVISLAILASMLTLTSGESATTARNNLYNSSIAAAEAATEQVIAHMNRDFVNQALGSGVSNYTSLVPSQTGWPVQYEFSDYDGNAGTGVQSLGPLTATNLDSQFSGLYGMVLPYRVISTAKPLTQTNLSATVSQSFQLAIIPLFQFAIFYGLDMEINPGANMKVNGKVHGNGELFLAPNSSATLEFQDDVTAVGDINYSRSTNDPAYGSAKSMPVFDITNMPANASSLSVPIGTNNSPSAVQQILEPPPPGEDPNSAMGQERFYNLADIIISNSAGGIKVMGGAWNNFAVIAPDVTNGASSSYSFVTNTTFYDYREGKTIRSTDINVGKFRTWITNTASGGGATLNTSVNLLKSHDINSVYVLDGRSQSGSILNAARAVNGAQLPADGLSISTPMPLYVKGHYNLNNGDTTAGQTNTVNTKPAALIGDAITILSTSWSDNYTSGTSLSSRTPGNTTVNAAVIAGIVESATVFGTKHYSGGVENYLRLLENWSGGYTLTYNGSMIALFASRYGTNFWQPTGNYYNAPSRKWAFDMNFRDKDRLPPLTPQARKLVRGQWQVLPPPGT